MKRGPPGPSENMDRRGPQASEEGPRRESGGPPEGIPSGLRGTSRHSPLPGDPEGRVHETRAARPE